MHRAEEKMRINIFLALILIYYNIAERNDGLRENQQRAQNQGLETDPAEWSLVIVTCIINIYFFCCDVKKSSVNY